jgi:hypothetical protein
MSAPVKAVWITPDGPVPIEDLSRAQLIDAVYQLGRDLQAERDSHKRSMDLHRAIRERQMLPRRWSLMGQQS